MSEWSGNIKETRSSRLRTGYPRQPPSAKCEYDPKHDMRAKSDAYQGTIMDGIRKNINALEITNIIVY